VCSAEDRFSIGGLVVRAVQVVRAALAVLVRARLAGTGSGRAAVITGLPARVRVWAGRRVRVVRCIRRVLVLRRAARVGVQVLAVQGRAPVSGHRVRAALEHGRVVRVELPVVRRRWARHRVRSVQAVRRAVGVSNIRRVKKAR
jgi:hypothetical protein